MSTSSTTACSRSSTPATPEATDNLDPAITQEVVNAWCHSLSQDAFFVHDEPFGNDKEQIPPLDLGDLIQDDAYDDTPSSENLSSGFIKQSSPSTFAICVPTAGAYHQRPILDTAKSILSSSQFRRDLPTAAMQSVVYPSKDACTNLPIMFPSIPEGGTKSRVETQVRLTVDLAHASTSADPLKYDRVGSWKWLRLPKGTSTKRRTRKEGKIDAAPEETLFLTTDISCASPPHAKVTCCTSCQAREAKRIERKIAARIRPARSDDESNEEPASIPGRGKHEDDSKLIQFNCPEVLDFSMGTVILPLRITCYCRHHREKTGFNVHFTMYDHSGRVVGSGVTKPIMITDDHKSTGVGKSSTNPTAIDLPPEVEWASGNGERQETPNKRKGRLDAGGERMKKRTKPYDGRRSGKVCRKDSDGSLHSGALSSFATTRASTPALSNGSSPRQMLSTEPTTPDASDEVAAEAIANLLSSLDSSQATASSLFEDVVMPDAQHSFSPNDLSAEALAPVTFIPSELSTVLPASGAPSSPVAIPSPNMSVAPPVPFLFNPDPHPSINVIPIPKIHRLIPAHGPTYGGIEITVLGANFHPNTQLTCVFGDARASSTHRWSDNTLVCLLPPSATAGVVPVWFDGIAKEEDGSPPTLFVYQDDTDRALMELALQVVGLKMTGRIEDAREVAMRIVNTTGPDSINSATSEAASGAMQLAAALNFSADVRRVLLSGAGKGPELEKLVLDFLTILDTPLAVPTRPVASAISHTNNSGQTLLHLATFLGFTGVVEFLIEHDIDMDARDRNGFTALHFAALGKSAPCAQLLIEGGAALDIVNALGQTPAEIAPAGLFDDLFVENPITDDDDQSIGNSDGQEEEATWGDIDEVESDEERCVSSKAIRRHRSDRKLKEKPTVADTVTPIDVKPPLEPLTSAQKAKEASLVDEKQLAASIMEMVQRTFAQLQHPQMPNLPLQFPGMPAWGALPQMPAVFPVYVPMIPAFWSQDRRGDQGPATGEATNSNRNQQWLGIPSAQEWKAVWDKWVQATRPGEDAPPAYTPRETESVDIKADKSEASSSQASTPPSTTAAKRVTFGPVNEPLSETEVKSFGYRPAKKQARKHQQVKHDRMLVLFWIPILLIGLIWALLHSMRVGFHAVKAILNIPAALHA
ncbi:hypothetical protein BDY19DRAFT_922042 [Irpex rosettiformis]|uniref:Uncharacterized protein n=1 Tax=Irpex rosettiformis TaxID=378272 RepID=A0ACB8UFC6_9APHY|nr:hypothetical protein BDY19DRAFT_922042 [Irpex rosettiformis]